MRRGGRGGGQRRTTGQPAQADGAVAAAHHQARAADAETAAQRRPGVIAVVACEGQAGVELDRSVAGLGIQIGAEF